MGENLCGFAYFLQTAKAFPTKFINAILSVNVYTKSYFVLAKL